MSCFVLLGSEVICFRALKRLVYEILLKARPEKLKFDLNLSEFQVVRIPIARKENYWPFQLWSKPLDKGPLTSQNFCCSLTKFESAATSRLPVLFSNIRSLINSSTYLGEWRLRGTGFSTKIFSCKSFSGINLLKRSFVPNFLGDPT